MLSPNDFGVISIANTLLSYFALFTQSSTGLFILYKGIDDRRYLNTVYTISFIVGAVLGICLALSSPTIANFFNEPSLIGILRVYSLHLLITSIFYIYEAIMLRQGQYREVALIMLAASMASLSTTITCALIGLGYWAFVFGDIVFGLLSLTLGIWQSKHILSFKISKRVFSEVIQYCLGAIGTSLGFYSNLNIDNFVVGKTLGNISLGYYNLAYQLTGV